MHDFLLRLLPRCTFCTPQSATRREIAPSAQARILASTPETTSRNQHIVDKKALMLYSVVVSLKQKHYEKPKITRTFNNADFADC